jgi:hypothetical protein
MPAWLLTPAQRVVAADLIEDAALLGSANGCPA